MGPIVQDASPNLKNIDNKTIQSNLYNELRGWIKGGQITKGYSNIIITKK